MYDDSAVTEKIGMNWQTTDVVAVSNLLNKINDHFTIIAISWPNYCLHRNLFTSLCTARIAQWLVQSGNSKMYHTILWNQGLSSKYENECVSWKSSMCKTVVSVIIFFTIGNQFLD